MSQFSQNVGTDTRHLSVGVPLEKLQRKKIKYNISTFVSHVEILLHSAYSAITCFIDDQIDTK